MGLGVFFENPQSRNLFAFFKNRSLRLKIREYRLRFYQWSTENQNY